MTTEPFDEVEVPLLVPTSPLVLLLVQQELQEGLLRVVSARGWPAKTYPHSAGFLRFYRRGRRQCLILDLDLPDGQALPLLSSLSTIDPDLDVVVLGSPEVTDAVSALRLGAVQYIRKPFLDSKLGTELQNIFAR